MATLIARTAKRMPRWRRWVLVNARRANVFYLLALVSAAALSMMIVVDWLTISAGNAQSRLLPSRTTTSLLVGTLVPTMALLVLWGRWLALRRAARGLVGSNGQLHVRLVWLFSLVAAIPTLLVVLFASLLFQSGVEFWFSDNSRGMLENANKLARGYYDQNLRDVGNETVTMAGDLHAYLDQAAISSPAFAEGYSFQVVSRRLNESAILQKSPDGALHIAAIVDPEKATGRQRVTQEELRRLDAGESVVVTPSEQRIEAVTTLDRERGIYLYAARNSDALALSQWVRAQSVLKAYGVLISRAGALQLRFNIALFTISLALVGLSVWLALRIADRQVAPLAELVFAARRVGSGNLAMRVPPRGGADEIGMLSRAFNRMTAQIESQTQALVGANAKLEERRAFIEAVVEAITAGIISVDATGTVQLMNTSARRLLLGSDGPPPLGLSIEALAPQLAELRDSGQASGLVHTSSDKETRTLAVKVVADANGHVITFEDITAQLLDQRRAAWSDVARRIAHEIKNPLTPIQLATERLRRRYGRQITADPELFDELTSTIIRQVGDLRKMVDEFSSFARLPKPVFRSEDANDLVRQALFLQEVAHGRIGFSFACDEPNIVIACDRHQIGQAMTNVLKNAVEAVEARAAREDVDYRGRIAVTLAGDRDSVTISVTDNGVGLPPERDRILEPYVTTRERGTGLGLAIVSKIVEEHGGEMAFVPEPGGGTRVIIRLARDPLARADARTEARGPVAPDAPRETATAAE